MEKVHIERLTEITPAINPVERFMAQTSMNLQADFGQ